MYDFQLDTCQICLHTYFPFTNKKATLFELSSLCIRSDLPGPTMIHMYYIFFAMPIEHFKPIYACKFALEYMNSSTSDIDE